MLRHDPNRSFALIGASSKSRNGSHFDEEGARGGNSTDGWNDGSKVNPDGTVMVFESRKVKANEAKFARASGPGQNENVRSFFKKTG